jgi:nitroimidazol reductase NimA-like FMN-containing flavoprotein (pyridoxamine 5'-phosphate oxidase superfamily)
MPTQPELVPVRRKDRAVTDEAWIEAMLLSAPFGVLALSRDGQPYVNMNVFVYAPERRCIFMHTASEGTTRSNVAANERVCFCVSEMGRLLPAIYARNFSVEYSGVIVFGKAEVVTDPMEAHEALQRLLDKYAPHLRPGEHYRPITGEELAQTTVYRVQIDKWSGKKKEAAAEHPGAFRYGQPAAAPWSDWRQREVTS